MKRWKCPQCGSGRVGPDTLDAEDSRGFCFPCSDSTGHLVRRVAPAIEKATERRKRQRVARREAQREREAKREWQRQHTWPGVRELRWAKWTVKGTRNGGELPKVKNTYSIAAYYAQMFRLGLPTAPNDDRLPVTEGWSQPRKDAARANVEDQIRARANFLRRVGVDTGATDRLKDAHDQNTFIEVYRYCQDRAIDWLIEDLHADGGGTFDATGEMAIRGAAERCDLSKPDDVRSLNTIILNAFAVADDRAHDDGHEPIGGWQGAH